MAAPAYYEMQSLVLGDTWRGIPNITINPSGVLTTDLSSARIQFRKEKSRGGDPLDEISTTNSGIIINSATGWSISIPPQNLNLLVGNIYWDLETIDNSGHVKTYLEGILPVLQDVSRG